MEQPLFSARKRSSVPSAMWSILMKSLAVILAETSQIAIRMTNIILVGRHDKYLLDGVGIAHFWWALTASAVSFGLSGGLDTLCSQSYGRGEHKRVGI